MGRNEISRKSGDKQNLGWHLGSTHFTFLHIQWLLYICPPTYSLSLSLSHTHTHSYSLTHSLTRSYSLKHKHVLRKTKTVSFAHSCIYIDCCCLFFKRQKTTVSIKNLTSDQKSFFLEKIGGLGEYITQRKHSSFPPSSPRFKSWHSQDFFSSLWTVLRLNP